MMSAAYLKAPEISFPAVQRYGRLTACQGKSRFETPLQAFRAATRNPYFGLYRQQYFCRFCGGWHLGTNWEGNIPRQARRKFVASWLSSA